MEESKGQVQLSELIFTMSWEDPECDRRALRVQPTDRVVTVSSGGCNTLSLLLDDPREIFAVDINPAQSFLLELKMAAIRRLEYPDFLGFLGVQEHHGRREIFGILEDDLTPDARSFWRERMPLIDAGFMGKGKYEKFIGMFRTILRLLQGRGRIERMFVHDGMEEQRAYFNDEWNTRRWRGIFKIFFSKTMLARRGLSADYFHFDDGSQSFAESFSRRARHAMADLPIKGNYFLAQYLLGRYLDDTQVPEYLIEANFNIIRTRLDRIRVITSDLKQWLEQQSEDSFDCYALSNICELMDHEDTLRTFRAVVRAARPRARMIFRNLMIDRTVPVELASLVLRDEKLSQELRGADRSFVYSRVDALFLGPSSQKNVHVTSLTAG